MKYYMISYTLITVLALVNWKIDSNYWKFLFSTWKIVTFVIAASIMILVSPYTIDPTWDYYDSSFTSLLTFLTAPWCVGTIARYLISAVDKSHKQFFVAVSIWMFSTSWSYDLYITYRDHVYPATWWANIFASGILYLCAGLFWNLKWSAGDGMHFAFFQRDWFELDRSTSFRKIWSSASLFIILITFLLYPLVF